MGVAKIAVAAVFILGSAWILYGLWDAWCVLRAA
jgi:hypothetical protein